MNRVVLTLDVGGTKLAAAVVREDGVVDASREVPTPAAVAGEAETVFTAIAVLLDAVLADAGRPRIHGVGAGCGGPMTREAVSPLNIPAWRGFPLAARLEAEFGVPVAVDNDAKAMALGEGWLGAARGESCFVGLVVSTGVGGGIVLDGRLLHGRETNAGHIGHVVVNPGGEPCACGARGCLEAEASGSAVARKAARRVLNGEAGGGLLEAAWTQGRLQAETPPPRSSTPVSARFGLTARDVATAAEGGDPVAVAVLAEAGRYVGLAVADVANLLDLGVAVVGGGVAGAGELLFGPCRDAAATHARLDHSRDLTVVPAALGRRAGVIGAAALWYAAHPP
ncbi:MAG: ROK family protein [Acidimicrobiia bacterium]|nr:ROK family protein [Acidimicrobiia bacterium]